MKIKSIVIEGQRTDVEICATSTGAHAMGGEERIAHLARDEDPESRYAKAEEVARAVYDSDRRVRVSATNSMVHDVLREMERVAGC